MTEQPRQRMIWRAVALETARKKAQQEHGAEERVKIRAHSAKFRVLGW